MHLKRVGHFTSMTFESQHDRRGLAELPFPAPIAMALRRDLAADHRGALCAWCAGAGEAGAGRHLARGGAHDPARLSDVARMAMK
jgi:hypothetical protein